MPNSTTITYQKVNMAGTTAASFHAIKTWLEDPYLDVFKRLLQVRILTRKKIDPTLYSRAREGYPETAQVLRRINKEFYFDFSTLLNFHFKHEF